MKEIVREVQAIWAPLVKVVVDPPEAPTRIGAIRLALRAEERLTPAASAHDPAALGWIEFVDGQPQPLITVSLERARVVVSRAVVAGRLVQDWPAVVGERLTAVAIGRAIAHEVGHYLLQSPAHSRTGLMRAGLATRDLTERGTARLGLSKDERERVARRLAAPVWASAPKSDAQAVW
ncbi:MAG: hypothetical protein ACKVOX_08345 [Rhizobacter sp.]